MTKAVVGVLFAALLSVGRKANAQTRYAQQRTVNLVNQLETNTDRFRRSLDTSLDCNRLNGTETEEDITARVNAFEYATDRLRERVEDGEAIASDVENVLSRALLIEMIMDKTRTSVLARQDWRQTRNVLDRLARQYNVAWVWTLNSNPYWNTSSVARVFDRLELRSDEFRRSFNDALDASSLNGTERENEAVSLVRAFEDSTDRVEDLVDRRERLKASDVETMLRQAQSVETFLRANNLSPPTRRDWAQVKVNLAELARMSNVSWTWSAVPTAAQSSR